MENISRIPELFGCMVFGDSEMRARLPEEVYTALRRTIRRGAPLNPEIATPVADAMRAWALERGATHYTHWFQPLTGITAEKHDSVIEPAGEGEVIMKFSGKSLVRGESDASSFPNGGLRATFEARGYTAWDPTSPAFVRDNTLYIPTAFCSFGGHALDKKTPLLRSMECLRNASRRLMAAFGKTDIGTINPTVGAEQEYFLIPRELVEARPDLLLCGRTLFGARPPKAQELGDHYFGTIRPRVKAFMDELDLELWKLGIMAKTEHNEAAPSQHELAPIFCTTNIACDHNQLTMEMMKRVAAKHHFVCLLHEKPFAYVNGSGKHNNWSISTSRGVNLLEPGDSPEDNAQFLLILTALIAAVDEYADLLRISVADEGNDHRLGANEAPPAILSVFLGSDLTEILDCLAEGRPYDQHESGKMDIGASVLPKFPKDNTDRNRTSPFAFTGNKFEFRMLGSSCSIADANTVMNTIVSEYLDRFSARLEQAEDFNGEVKAIVSETYLAHKRIIFDGNGYSEDWCEEAARRGLHNYPTAAEAIPHLVDPANVALFEKHGIFTEVELRSRCDIMLETVVKHIGIEASTMLVMAKKDILPAVYAYTDRLSEGLVRKMKLGIPQPSQHKLLSRLAALADEIAEGIDALESAYAEANAVSALADRALVFSRDLRDAMGNLRRAVDEAEMLVAREDWPYPSYTDILFYR